MNGHRASDARLGSLITAYADLAPTDVDPMAMARSIVTGPQRSRLSVVGPMPLPQGRWVAFALLALLAAMLAGVVASGRFQEPRYRGVFEPAGVLAGPFLEAAQLSRDRILVVESGGDLEYYESATGRFVPGGSTPAIAAHLPGPPHEFGASRVVVLGDGRVVQSAGLEQGGPCRATGDPRLVIFDPRSGSVVESGSTTPDDRKGVCARGVFELLDDGRVLVVGEAAERFDPATGAFSPTGPLGDDFEAAGAVRLADGRVLLIGTFRPLHEGHRPRIFDPSSGTFRLASSTIPGLAPGSFTSTLLRDGRVLIAGGSGWEVGVATDRAYLFDPVYGTFAPVGPLTRPRAGHTATLLADGRVLIAGGATTDPDARSRAHPTAAAEVFDPVSSRFDPTAPMSLPRAGASAFTLPDGSVLILGGSAQRSAELFR